MSKHQQCCCIDRYLFSIAMQAAKLLRILVNRALQVDSRVCQYSKNFILAICVKLVLHQSSHHHYYGAVKLTDWIHTFPSFPSHFFGDSTTGVLRGIEMNSQILAAVIWRSSEGHRVKPIKLSVFFN